MNKRVRKEVHRTQSPWNRLSSTVVATTRHKSPIATQASKALSRQSSGENYKKTWQGASTKLESYIYKIHLVWATNNYGCPYDHATTSYLSYSLLKATMLYTCALTSSYRSFYSVLGLWRHIMWHVMWLQCHMPLPHPKKKEKENKINIKSER